MLAMPRAAGREDPRLGRAEHEAEGRRTCFEQCVDLLGERRVVARLRLGFGDAEFAIPRFECAPGALELFGRYIGPAGIVVGNPEVECERVRRELADVVGHDGDAFGYQLMGTKRTQSAQIGHCRRQLHAGQPAAERTLHHRQAQVEASHCVGDGDAHARFLSEVVAS